MDLDSSRDELHVLATYGLTAVTGATSSQVAVEALILPCRKPSPQRFAGAWTRQRRSAGVLPIWRRPSGPSPNRKRMLSPGLGNHGVSRTNFRTSCPLTRGRAWPAGGQRATRRAGRVRPLDASFAAQRSISGRNQSFTRPSPRSTMGRGMSSYLRWYRLTLLRCDRESKSATAWASRRSSVATRGDTCQGYIRRRIDPSEP